MAAWSRNSSFSGKTYWIHIDQLSKVIQSNPIYLKENLQPLSFSDIKATGEVGNYIKLAINEHYFDLQDWKQVIGARGSSLNAISDNAMLDEKVIDSSDTLFKVKINDMYHTAIPFNTLNQAVFRGDSDKLYTILDKNPASLFNWDVRTWQRLEENIPWIGMTQDMLLMQFKQAPDQKTKVTTKFNTIELWIYTDNYGDSIYYFKDGVLSNIL